MASCELAEVKSGFNGTLTVHGGATLHVGHIRNLELAVERDGEKHATIKGLPYQDKDPALVNKLAGALSDQSRLVWPEG